MPKGGRTPQRRLHHGEARERIIEAAETLFAVDGYDGVSFQYLTAAAGVSLSAIHYHFGSKEAVFSEIFARRASLLTKRRLALLEAALRYGGRPAALESILDAFLAQLSKSLAATATIFSIVCAPAYLWNTAPRRAIL